MSVCGFTVYVRQQITSVGVKHYWGSRHLLRFSQDFSPTSPSITQVQRRRRHGFQHQFGCMSNTSSGLGVRATLLCLRHIFWLITNRNSSTLAEGKDISVIKEYVNRASPHTAVYINSHMIRLHPINRTQKSNLEACTESI